MTPEAQRIAIAEARGWRAYPGHGGKFFSQGGFIKHVTELPDYLADLNAMHEAEKTLAHHDKEEYFDLLSDECGTKGCVMATAAQRAEAFLRTIGKWEDSP